MKTAINIAKKYIAHVKKSGIPVSAAYLFGSFAKGVERKYRIKATSIKTLLSIKLKIWRLKKFLSTSRQSY